MTCLSKEIKSLFQYSINNFTNKFFFLEDKFCAWRNFIVYIFIFRKSFLSNGVERVFKFRRGKTLHFR